MQLHFLQHSQIDKQRWLHTIQQSSNGLIYAWPQFLDAMSPGWQALVSDDYNFLMPLTYRSKFGIRYLYQPAFCQQLGVFGNDITETTITAFLQKANQQFSFAEVQINYQNGFPSNEVLLRKNYVLPLKDHYEIIRSRYSKDLLKKNLLRTEKFNLQYHTSSNTSLAIDTFEELYTDRLKGNLSKDYAALKQLAPQLETLGNAFVREVRLPNGELLACSLFLKDDRRIYNIASSTLPNGRTLEANHFLFDKLIQEFSNSNLLLDFEGSEVVGIERFYKKFGSYNQPYFSFRWNHLPWPLRLLKK